MPKVFLKALVAVCAMCWLGKLWLAGALQEGHLLALAGPFSLVTLVADGLLFAFDRWAWAWPAIAPFVKRPDLRGTWKGKLVSEWVDKQTGKSTPPIEMYACITQTASTLHLRMFTKESGSLTVSAALIAQADDAQTFVATYHNEPKAEVRHRSEIHFGAFRLQLAGDKLSGTYWTDRNTRGHMELARVSVEKCHSFEHAKKLTAAALKVGVVAERGA